MPSMQYQFNERYEYVKTVEFLNSLPLVNVERIRYYKEEDVTGSFTKIEFRYSWDNVIWSHWNTLTQGNLSSIQFRDNPEFYLHIKYSRAGVGAGNIQRWYLFYDSNIPTPPVPPSDSSLDANTLGGQPPSYYLNRENFFGPYTDLEISNIDSSGIGVYSHRVDTSMGSEFYFKKIQGSSNILISDSSSGQIIIDASIEGGGSYENSDPVNQTVGGITSGSTFFSGGKTFSETMQAMFFPTLYPTLTNPSNSFTDNVSSLQIVGNIISITFTASFNRGSINPSYGTSGYRSGDASTYFYSGYGLPSSVQESSPSNIQTVNSYTVLVGNQSWSSYVYYKAGEQPKDSIGGDYNSPLPAGTTGSQSTSFEGVHPLYGTTSLISNPNTQQTLVSMLSGNNIVFNMVPESGGYKQSFDIANEWIGSPTNRPIIGIETYNTVSSSWEYQGGSSGGSLTYWNTSSVLHGSENYTRYTYNGTDRSSIQIRLKF